MKKQESQNLPNISVAMATYNGGRFISEQLASLAAQTFKPLELVVCDDGSTDDTIKLIEEFASVSPFCVRLVRNETRLGYAENFLKAASLCRGAWTAFCDQDDCWMSEKLARVANVIVRNPDLVLVAHPAYLVNVDMTQTGKIAWPSRERRYRRLSHSPWRSGMGCGQVFRSALVREIPYVTRFRNSLDPEVQRSPHDDWILKISQCVGDAYYMSEPLVYRRRHGQSATAARHPPTNINARRSITYQTAEELERFAFLAADMSEVLASCAINASEIYRGKLSSAGEYYSIASSVLRRRASWRVCRIGGRIVGMLSLLGDMNYWLAGDGIVGWRGMARDIFDLFRKAHSDV